MSDRARLRTARRNLKEFVKAMCSELPKTEPADRYVRTALGKLYVADIQILLRAEKTHRTSIRYLTERVRSQCVELEVRGEDVSDLQAKLEDARTENERLLHSGGAVADALRKEQRELRALLVNAEQERDRAQAALSNLRAQSRPFVPDPSVPALRRLVEERGWEIKQVTAERDALQRALDNLRSSVRKGVPEKRARWDAAVCKELAAAVAALSKAAEALDA